MSSMLVLAVWQLRQTWRLLLITGLGILTATVLMYTIPLYTQVTTTVGLRNAIHTTNGASDIIAHSSSEQVDASHIDAVQTTLTHQIQQNLGPYLAPSSEFSLDMYGPAFHVTDPTEMYGNQMQLIGYSMSQILPHLTLVQGRLPGKLSDTVETVMTPEAAQRFHVTVGNTIPMSVFYTATQKTSSVDSKTVSFEQDIPLVVVGLVIPKDTDLFWRQQDFRTLKLAVPPSNSAFWHTYGFPSSPRPTSFFLARAVVSNETIVAALARQRAGLLASETHSTLHTAPLLKSPPGLFWYYHLDLARIDIDALHDVLNGLNTLPVTINGSPYTPFVDGAYVEQTQVSDIPDPLIQYSTRLGVLDVPVGGLTLLVIGLLLFFVSVMTDLLVDQHIEEIALLRSRGANARQIFVSLLLQGIALSIVALLLSPFIAVLVVVGLTHTLLATVDQEAVSISTPLLAVQVGGLFALSTAVVSVLAMCFALSRTARMNVLALRQEQTRSSRLPLWLRLRLDIIAAVIALLGYLFSLYITSPGVLHDSVRVLILAPLTLVGTVFLVLACALLFLRYFPVVLRLLVKLVERGRSAAPTLALVHIARSPRQLVRISLLLSLAIAFALFSLIFSASQTQRIPDVAAFQVGADFTGTLPGSITTQPLQEQTARYRRIPGVRAVSIGYVSLVTLSYNELDTPIAIQAVDADTFAQTALWTGQDSTQPLAPLMAELASKRASSIHTLLVPAIVDASALAVLHIKPGDTFSLNETVGPIPLVAVARVEHIPTVNDSPDTARTFFNAVGGVLVDYQTYRDVYAQLNQGAPSIKASRIWLRTSDDAADVQRVRNVLRNGDLQLAGLNDRRAVIDALYHDPLYSDIVGVLLLGTLTTLVLALIGGLTASWLNARGRVISFAVLRAMGSTPRQITSVLLWEQIIVYLLALVLGLFFGGLLSVVALPALIFTSINTSAINGITDSSDLYSLQSLPPIQLIIPDTVWLALGSIVGICLVALLLMVRIVSVPIMSQVLRLSEN